MTGLQLLFPERLISFLFNRLRGGGVGEEISWKTSDWHLLLPLGATRVKWMTKRRSHICGSFKHPDLCESAEGQKQFALDHFIRITMFFNEAKASPLWPYYVFQHQWEIDSFGIVRELVEQQGYWNRGSITFSAVILNLKWL